MDITKRVLNLCLSEQDVLNYFYSKTSVHRGNWTDGVFNVNFYLVEFELAIQVIQTKKNSLHKILASPNSSDQINRLINNLNSCLKNQDNLIVVTDSLYSPSIPVKGYFRSSSGRFQILQVPSEWPQFDVSIGNHPFIIQANYFSSGLMWVDAARQYNVIRELKLFLVGAVKGNFISFSATSKWGVPVKDFTSPPQEFYEDYLISLPTQNSSEFMALEGLNKIPTELISDHYNSKLNLGDDQALPVDLNQQFDKLMSITKEEKERYYRCCYWVEQSNITPSTTLSYLSLALSLESLLPDPENIPQCPTCKRASDKSFKVSVGEQVKGLLLKHAFLSEEDASKIKGRLYDLRSKIAHGDHVFEQDENRNTYFSRQEITENNDYQLLKRIVRVTLYNWLNSLNKAES